MATLPFDGFGLALKLQDATRDPSDRYYNEWFVNGPGRELLERREKLFAAKSGCGRLTQWVVDMFLINEQRVRLGFEPYNMREQTSKENIAELDGLVPDWECGVPE